MQKYQLSTGFTFKSLYVAFVICVIFYGQLRVAFGLTPRHIAIVVMLIACMSQGVPFPMGRIMKTYFVFIIAYLFSATITGYLGEVLITYYIASVVGFWATKILVDKYDDGKLLLNLFVVLGVLDAIVTVGQTLNLGFSDQLVSFLSVTLPEDYLDQMDDGGEDRFLLIARPGLLANVVYNGYFLMTAGVASLVLIARKLQLHRFVPWVVIFLGCICVQERGPIIILAVLSAFSFFKVLFVKKHINALFLIVVLFIVLIIAGSIANLPGLQSVYVQDTNSTYVDYYDVDGPGSDMWNNFSRITNESRFANKGLEDSNREITYRQTIDYLMDYPLIGGLHRLRAKYGIYPHNLFFNAFVYGGIVGGVAILLILFWQIKPLWRVLRRKIADTNPVCFFAGLAYIAYTLNSLVHNRSIVTGDEVIWMLWAAFYCEYRKFYPRDTRL